MRDFEDKKFSEKHAFECKFFSKKHDFEWICFCYKHDSELKFQINLFTARQFLT